MTCKEAIILAGGFGTRLQSVVSDIPKPMASVGDKPFLFYILRYLESFGIERTVLSVGYRHEIISQYFGSRFGSMELLYAIENQPLGTGGAVKYASEMIQANRFFLLNGDSFFRADLKKLYRLHNDKEARITLSLKEMQNFDRYGSVEMTPMGLISAFNEKRFCESGLINTGIYVIEKHIVANFPEQKFSLEKDILEKEITNNTVYGQVYDGFFIDIGIPDDYQRVQSLVEELM
jgi:D-glycero-alpha-D-manno-heptose 1-phosphate guanylyltransferase